MSVDDDDCRNFPPAAFFISSIPSSHHKNVSYFWWLGLGIFHSPRECSAIFWCFPHQGVHWEKREKIYPRVEHCTCVSFIFPSRPVPSFEESLALQVSSSYRTPKGSSRFNWQLRWNLPGDRTMCCMQFLEKEEDSGRWSREALPRTLWLVVGGSANVLFSHKWKWVQICERLDSNCLGRNGEKRVQHDDVDGSRFVVIWILLCFALLPSATAG